MEPLVWNSRGGSGLTLPILRTYLLDPFLQKRFQQSSEALRLFDRCEMSCVEQLELRVPDGIRNFMCSSRWRACIVASSHSQSRKGDLFQSTAHIEIAQ